MKNLAVLIAVYARDDPELFDAALSSILSQRLNSNFKVNIYLGVDGPIGSDLENVLSHHGKHIYRILRSSINQGLAATLNELIDSLSKEPFIFRMDADDFSLPDRFQCQVDFLNNNPDVDIVGTDIIEWDRATDLRRVVSYAVDHNDALQKVSRRVPVAHPSVCFRSRVLKIVPHYPNVIGNEDIAMWFECLKAGLRISNVHVPLLQFTIGKNFWARRSFQKSFSEFLCYSRGIYQLRGFTWHYVFPIARLIFRLMPRSIVKHYYNSNLRRSDINLHR